MDEVARYGRVSFFSIWGAIEIKSLRYDETELLSHDAAAPAEETEEQQKYRQWYWSSRERLLERQVTAKGHGTALHCCVFLLNTHKCQGSRN